ncbi:MAG: hypothetical protein BWK79_15940 [Beggiatoa sp. IS2]|nr:MAG: hypothetical protein BWK79_15940 [Beggiatoa sp. IS2]
MIDPAQRARQLELAGNYAEAAQEYLRLADQNYSPTKQGYQLSAAEALVKANKVEQAKVELARIDFDKGVSLQIPRELIYARIDLAEGRAGDAARRLNGIINANMLPVPWRIKYYELQAQVLEAKGNLLEAVRERVNLDNLLNAESLPTAVNHQAIWSALTSLPTDSLKQTGQGNDNLSGWLSLAALAKTAKARTLNQSLESWKMRFPNHPAMQDIISELLSTAGKTLSQTKEIALLLPLSGKFGGQAEAVSDGFLAAWYADKDKASKPSDTPNVMVYDVDTSNIVKKYQELVQTGVDFIVGPLDKDALAKLIQSQPLFSIPTLSLNYVELSARLDNLYQFGLAPEDEATEIATRAWADGRRVAAAFIPEGEWGRRILRSFQTTWERLGGRLGKTQTYGKDVTTPIKQLVQNLGDADMVFLLAFPEQARKARPYMKYNAATNLPIYSTSHVYDNGTPEPGDRDIDDVIFIDMPWILAPDAEGARLREKLQQHWPEAMKKFRRLYALGIDAYQLLPELQRLTGRPTEKWQGQTGMLSLDNTGMVHRQLRWARFVNGVPQLLNENVPMPLANETDKTQ